MNKINKKVPFDSSGNMMDYDAIYACQDSYVNIDITFEATMKYTGFGRGRSSIKMYFVDINTNKKYAMFISEFDRIIKLENSCIHMLSGTFGFHKKGSNYGLRYIKPLEETKPKNKLTIIGWLGARVAFLNLTKEEAINRYRNLSSPPDTSDDFLDVIEEFCFDDEFNTY